MQYKKLTFFFYIFIHSYSLFAQSNLSNLKLGPPVDFPIYLSGNFGEIRSTHFHSGIDIKTQGVTGKKVLAIEDGYISRIKVSANSYGKTIYINHANGITSVYGHLNHFTHKIDSLIKRIQYNQNEFEINYFPKVGELPVSKGQIIGFSGNTGNSHGPHLHFEIRETNRQVPLNPLLFDFNIADHIAPTLYTLTIYPLALNSSVNNQQHSFNFKLFGHNSNYRITDTNKVYLSGEIGFGIELNDFSDNSSNKCGIYNLLLAINGQIVYDYSIDKISFPETGYVKSHIDYAEKLKSNRTIQKLYKDPNNNLNIYRSLVHRGIFNFNKDTTYEIKIIAKDVSGNKSTLSFNATGQIPELPEPTVHSQDSSILMDWRIKNVFENEEIKVVIPAKSLYDTLHFKYSRLEPTDGLYSSIHNVHNIYTPIHKSYSISIKTFGLPEHLKDKALIVQVDNDEINSIGGEMINDYIVSESDAFGSYAVMIDTVPPDIKFIKNKNGTFNNKVEFFIKDELSGIKSYNGYIDNSWALFEYDLKNDLLFYIFDEEKIGKNKEHELELFVIDKCNNVSTYHTTFYW